MSKQKDIGYYVHSLIGIAIMFGFGYIVPPEPITATSVSCGRGSPKRVLF